MRVGFGYDVHQLTGERKLILGGVDIPYSKGLLGHSDADVLLHAIMDAMLGAAALEDIGKHFPDSDPKFSGADSLLLLKQVREILLHNHWRVHNVDATIIAQRPKLAPYIPDMIQNIAAALCINEDAVSVKATTTEHLGFEGREEGISACAVCTIVSNRPSE